MDLFDDQAVIPALAGKASLLTGVQATPGEQQRTYFSAPAVDLAAYDHIVVCMSGGKDSIAALLCLIDQGVDMTKLELWHHEVDGREGSTLMDWPFMTSYNRALAKAFDIPIYFSWLEGGFEGEMLKNNSFSRPHRVETPDGLLVLERDKTRGKPGTRMKFPQVAADLQTRWCSSALKIDVGRRALNNQPRFNGKKILFVTGERREESPNRAKYNQFEGHHSDRRSGRLERHIDAWRPVLHWSEERVWDALRRHGVVAPVPYRLGWGRSSCMKCIFNDAVIWATLAHHFPGSLDDISAYERQFGTTINRGGIPVLDLAAGVTPLEIADKEAFFQAIKSDYELPIFCKTDQWVMPAGAFERTGCGPS